MKKNLSELEVEFDAVQNAPLTFDQITRGRRNPVVWTCVICGYSWPARVYNRLKGTECPRCQGTIPIPGETDLATVFPRIAGEWDYSLNPKGPEEYLPYSNHKVAWICDRGHQWKEKINNRTVNGLNCPYCGGSRPIPGVNDMGTLFPWLAAQWDTEENGDLTPYEVLPKSNLKVSWVCERGHKWPAKIYHRTDGQGCPYCAGLKPILGETDLDTVAPEIARQWHPGRNKGRVPSEFTSFSHFEAIWMCDRGHEYPMPIYRRSRGCGCSVCDGKRIVPHVNDLATLAPNLAKEWDHSKNKLGPNAIALHNNDKHYWLCSKCGHSWRASMNNRASGKGCPKCSGHVVDPEVNSLAALNPFLCNQWDNEKNAPLTAWDVAAYDNRDYHWICENGHSFPASPANRTKGTRCPYCTGKLPVVGVNDFGTVCPSVATEWHPAKNNGLLPEHFLPYSHEDIWWMCSEGHEWEKKIYERANGNKCPYCSHREAIPGENDFGTLFPSICKEWHPSKNNELLPSQFLPNSSDIVWWKCERGHEWQKSIRARVQGNTCPYCEGKLPVIGEMDLAYLHPDLTKRWHYDKNEKPPELYFPECTTRVWWRCDAGHSFRAPIREMVLRWRCRECEKKHFASCR